MKHPRYPKVDGELVLSNSDAANFLRCPLRYQYDKEHGDKRSTIALAIGIALHMAAEYSDRNVISGRPRPALEDLEGYAVRRFDRICDEREMTESAVEQMSARARVTNYAAELWTALWQTAPVESETVISTRLPCGTTYVGTIDVLVEDGFGDRKSGRAWSQERADDSRQFSGYALLYKSRFGELPRRIFVDSLSEKKDGEVVHKQVETRRVQADVNDYEWLIGACRRGIDAGYDAPAAEGTWWCSEKWCPHFRNCVAVQGRASRCLD